MGSVRTLLHHLKRPGVQAPLGHAEGARDWKGTVVILEIAQLGDDLQVSKTRKTISYSTWGNRYSTEKFNRTDRKNTLFDK